MTVIVCNPGNAQMRDYIRLVLIHVSHFKKHSKMPPNLGNNTFMIKRFADINFMILPSQM